MEEFFASIFPELRLAGSVALAALLGAVVGWEREAADKPAGLRTHMLVCGASALFVGLGTMVAQEYAKETAEGLIRVDPIRILEAVVTGVSFLGAGTIIRTRGGSKVSGLTTAASLLATSAVGAAVALDRFVLAVCTTMLLFLILRWVQHLVPKGSSEET